MLMLNGVEMLDVQEAARLVHRSPETVRRWVWSGRVSHIKQGNRLLIPRSALTGESGAASTLTDWLGQRRAVLGTVRSGHSAADLVLQDRAERSGQSRAGR